MKRIFRTPFSSYRIAFLAVVLCLAGAPRTGQAQCLNAAYGLAPAAAFSPAGTGAAETIGTARSSSYSLVAVTAGVTYTFSSSIATDFITLSNRSGTTVLATGTGTATFTPTAYDTIRFYTHADAQCSDTPSSRTRRVMCTFPAPANNACATPVILTPVAGVACGSPVSGTTAGATAATGAPAPACGAAGVNDDVWYAFTATATAHSVLLSNVSDSTSVQVYAGSCGTFTAVAGACGTVTSAGSVPAAGLTVGFAYYVRVFSTSSAAAKYSSFGICITGAAANDDCGGAILLPVSASPTCTGAPTYSTIGASPSAGAGSSCGATGGNDDVWFKFVATASTLTLRTSSQTSTVMDVYAGQCGSLYALPTLCGSYVQAGGLTVGDTFYVRVYSSSSTVGVNSAFSLCIATPPLPPANDDCGTSTVLTPSSTNSCGSTVSGTILGATTSFSGAAPCQTGAYHNDVWYRFTATAVSHTLLVSNVVGGGVIINVAKGACNALTSVSGACATAYSSSVPGDFRNVAIHNLVVGTVYTIRVSRTEESINTPVTFDLCLISPPANDVCTAAVPLTPQPAGAITPTPGTTLGAWSGEYYSSCHSSVIDDVWYRFVATSTNHAISISDMRRGVGIDVYAPYNNSIPCSFGTDVACGISGDDGQVLQLPNLTVGNTYVFRVYTTSYTWDDWADFEVAVLTLPANAGCAGALPLPVSNTTTCAAPLLGSTYNSGASLTPAPLCGNTGLDDDVWYSFTATDTVQRLMVDPFYNDIAAQLYTGPCTALTVVPGGCFSFAPGSAAPTRSRMLSNLAIGTTYFVRLWTPSATAGVAGLFKICIAAQPARPVNDSCGGAIVIATTPLGTVCNPGLAASTDGARATATGYPSCHFLQGGTDDVWFKFTATQPEIALRIGNIKATYGTVTGVDYDVYAGACGALQQLVCGSGNIFSGVNRVVGNLTIGDTYYLRVHSSILGAYGSFNLCIQDTVLPPPLNCSYLQTPIHGDTAVSLTPTLSYASSTNATVYDVYFGTAPQALPLVATTYGPSYTPPGPLPQGTWYYTYAIPRNSSGTPVANCTGLVRSFRTLIRPANDSARNATLLTVGASCATSSLPYSMKYASQSAGEPFPGCKGDTDVSTVWFKFSAPSSGAVRVRTSAPGASGSQQVRLSVFSAVDSGNYATFTDLGCGAGTGTGRATVYLAGLQPGTRYYVGVDAALPTSYNGGSFCLEVHELDSSMLSTTLTCTGSDSSRADFKRTYRGWVSVVNASGLQANVRLTGTADSLFFGKQNRMGGFARTDTMAAGLVRPYLDRNLTLRSDSGAAGYELQLFFTRQDYDWLRTADTAFDSLTQLVVSRQNTTACKGAFGFSAASDSLLLPMDEGAAQGVRFVTVATKLLGGLFLHRGTAALTGCFPPASLAVSGLTGTSGTVSWSAPPGGTPASYAYEVRTSGAPGSGAAGLVASGTVAAPATAATVSGLQPATAYHLYVRTSCGGATGSAWAGPRAFSTTCPIITVQPASDTVCAGVPVTLAVQASSVSAYQWRRAGVAVSGAMAASYTLSFPVPADSNVAFDVVLTPTNSSCTAVISAPAILTVNRHGWTGAVSSAWLNAANWNACGVPTATSFVEIPAPGPAILFMPEISSAVSIWSINSSGNVTVAPGGNLQILGN